MRNRLVIALRSLRTNKLREEAGLAQTLPEMQNLVGFWQGSLPTLERPREFLLEQIRTIERETNINLEGHLANLLQGTSLGGSGTYHQLYKDVQEALKAPAAGEKRPKILGVERIK